MNPTQLENTVRLRKSNSNQFKQLKLSQVWTNRNWLIRPAQVRRWNLMYAWNLPSVSGLLSIYAIQLVPFMSLPIGMIFPNGGKYAHTFPCSRALRWLVQKLLPIRPRQNKRPIAANCMKCTKECWLPSISIQLKSQIWAASVQWAASQSASDIRCIVRYQLSTAESMNETETSDISKIISLNRGRLSDTHPSNPQSNSNNSM